ncbi:MAG: alpha-E domain-containing protein [Burkholderiaceae bacterium]|nr:alpha-E domain-containing protein [Burkholderiaceae bacterium]
MGFISIEQSENLFWLGRYVERVYLTLRNFDQLYDVLLDKDDRAYVAYCENLNIENIYENEIDFISRYLFDSKNPDSVYANLSRAYDNGIVLRNVISSASLSYLQMALDTLEEGRKTKSCILLNQQVIDYLLAFWGCIDDYCDSHQRRNVIKAGRYMERLDMQLRLHESWNRIDVTIHKLERRLEGARLSYSAECIRALLNYSRLGLDDKLAYSEALGIVHKLV